VDITHYDASNGSATKPVSRWHRHLAELLEALERWPWLDTFRTLYRRFREDRLALTAGSLTFTTLISLVPLVTVTLAAFAAFPMFGMFQQSLHQYFLQTLVPGTIAEPVLDALTQFSAKASRLGAFGLFALALSAVALLLTIDRTLNTIWRVRTPRPIGQRVLVYWTLVTLGPLLLGISLTITSYAVSASRGVTGNLPGSVDVLLAGLQLALLTVGMAALFRYVPNTHVSWRHAFAGGLFVGIGLEVARRLLAWYLVQVPTFSIVYGAFATVPIFLIWIYLGWVIVLLGAVIAAYAPSLQMKVVRWPDGPGSRFHLALTLLRELLQARESSRRGLSNTQLAEALRTDPLQTEPVLDALVALDWVGRLEEGGDARYVLLCDPARTSAQPLLSLMLLQPFPVLRAFWQRAAFDEMSLQEIIAR
jgi:membrane protein